MLLFDLNVECGIAGLPVSTRLLSLWRLRGMPSCRSAERLESMHHVEDRLGARRKGAVAGERWEKRLLRGAEPRTREREQTGPILRGFIRHRMSPARARCRAGRHRTARTAVPYS